MMWVFGYGSLTWKVDFPVEDQAVGCIRGYQRRFYQLSTDHRGTVAKPGRVVTLLESNNHADDVWGIAYKIRDADRESVIAHLDYREKGGYTRQQVLFHPWYEDEAAEKRPPFEIDIYVGQPNNFQFGGPADLDSLARQIVGAHGPSGANAEYVLNLASVMRKIAPMVQDDHLFALEAKVRELMDEKKELNIGDSNVQPL